MSGKSVDSGIIAEVIVYVEVYPPTIRLIVYKVIETRGNVGGV